MINIISTSIALIYYIVIIIMLIINPELLIQYSFVASMILLAILLKLVIVMNILKVHKEYLGSLLIFINEVIDEDDDHICRYSSYMDDMKNSIQAVLNISHDDSNN